MDSSVIILNHLETDNNFSNRFFSDEATFHESGKVNRYNVRIWRPENLNFTRSILKIMEKENVWCALENHFKWALFFVKIMS